MMIDYDFIMKMLMFIITLEILIFVFFVVGWHIQGMMKPDPAVIEYFRNCANSTDGCQLQSMVGV